MSERSRNIQRIASLIVALSAMGLAGSFAIARDASAPRPAAIVPQTVIEVPVLDEALIIGRISVSTSLALGPLADPGHIHNALVALRETQILSLKDYARLHVDPSRPVNVETLSETMNGALRAAGYRDVTVLILTTQVEKT